ncbi:MAG: MFS transporter, partial [Gammaproteobacteria bacterium]
MRKLSLLDRPNGRFLAFGLMYAAEGIPYGFSSVALVAFMRQQGLSIEQIGIFVAAIFLPWSFKWAWAPILDIFRLNRFGGRKAWIQGCTTMLIVTFVFLALTDFSDDFGLLLVMVVANNFFCATLDIAIDSLAVGVLPEKEHGRGNGYMFGGQSLGIALGGGGAIFIFGLGGLNLCRRWRCGGLIQRVNGRLVALVAQGVDDPGGLQQR